MYVDGAEKVLISIQTQLCAINVNQRGWKRLRKSASPFLVFPETKEMKM